METVTSKDGTRIAYDKTGAGPAVILVDGALGFRAFSQELVQLADLLGPQFTVYRYDRRGRGDSTDTQPYAVQREIEDIEALVDEAGGSAYVYGVSSGACLAMEAAAELPGKITKLAMYEPPYNDDEIARQAWRAYTNALGEALAAGRLGEAVALFMKYVGANDEQVNEMRSAPVWPMFESVAPTLAYDHIYIMGEDASVPVGRAARDKATTLIITGGESFPFMPITAQALVRAIPKARHRVLEGQTHQVSSEALAPVLAKFFADENDI